MDGGLKRKQTGSKKSQTSRKSQSSKKHTARKSRAKSRRAITLPKTQSPRSRKSTERNRAARAARADVEMSMTDLQMMAKSRGIPFGGLSKARLAQKINNYVY